MRTVLQLFFTVVLLASAHVLRAQEESQGDSATSTPWISVSGSASITSDFYEFEANPSGSQLGRRPAVLHRLLVAPTITIGGVISLPLNVLISFPETNTTTPAINAPTLADIFTNPANALGLSSFSPKIGWAQFHLGSHTPQLSELSGGDLQLFGLGVDLRPGSVQLTVSRGISQRAVEPDVVRGINGAYRRDMTMGRLAFGNPDTTSVGINVVYAKDDVGSLRNTIMSIIPTGPLPDDTTVIVPADTVRLRAEEGLIATIDAKMLLAPGVTLSAEGAVSAFTRDLSSALMDQAQNPISGLLSARTSTRFDGAGNASLSLRYTSWGLTLTALYMGAGFQPLGYPFVQTDRIDLKVSPSLNLFDGDVSMNATVGQRVNNISQTRGEQLTQIIANGQIGIRFSDVFSLSSTYSNFGIRNNRQNPFDSARIQNVSESFSIDPTVTFAVADIYHTITASAGIDRFDDFNIISGVESSNNTRSVLLSYTGMMQSIPLTYGTSFSYMENNLALGKLMIRSIGLNASYRLLDGDLVPSVSVTQSESAFAANSADEQMFVKFGARWRITKYLIVTGNYSLNTYRYGAGNTRAGNFSEQMLNVGISTTF
ncbi:MAG: hypothetical protein FGM33_08020 [Candidatus Kapabacteria bacterium]|nr:hypothetical protein [Candidatus Kapabacteria bacterium]